MSIVHAPRPLQKTFFETNEIHLDMVAKLVATATCQLLAFALDNVLHLDLLALLHSFCTTVPMGMRVKGGGAGRTGLQFWPEIPVISTKKTPFITCIIPLK